MSSHEISPILGIKEDLENVKRHAEQEVGKGRGSKGFLIWWGVFTSVSAAFLLLNGQANSVELRN